MKASIPFIVLLFVSGLPVVHSQPAALYEVSFEDRIGSSELIVEGRVTGQESFWNAAGTLILTSNRVEVYRVFKGAVASNFVDVVTLGGVVGWKAQVVSHSVNPAPGEVGVFFLTRSNKTEGLAKQEETPAFEVYAAEQGFIRYDEASGLASDIFNIYSDIDREVRGRLADALGSPRVLVDYAAPTRRSSKGAQIPVITSFSPNPVTAGTATVLTI
ncbi:MAG: hypothetical protein R3282_06225, partial [Rhodothermales bacterium]|nr:hypothetical protein [Rhodothermales bacterium]